MKNKNTGAYYTPNYLASFLTNRVFDNVEHDNQISVLEPSVGDGAFIGEIRRYVDNFNINLIALDIDEKELIKASEKWINSTNFIHQDFLEFEIEDRFSVIIGNPPYIKKNRLNNEQIERIKQIHFDAGLSEKSVKNIWTTFLIKSCRMLTDDGILAFILPSELLQVKFAEEIRDYLQNEFERIEVFTFNDLMFDCKGQDTIVLMCYKMSENKGVFYTNIEDSNQLIENNFQLSHNDVLLSSSLKWTHHFLTSDEVTFLENLKEQLNKVSYYCDSKPGIVTGANGFFIVNKDTQIKYKLDRYTSPIIQKGLYVNGGVVFDNENFQELYEANNPSLLLKLNNEEVLTKSLKDYLKNGVELGLPERYKCKLRKNWFVIPNVTQQTEGLFFKRSHLYPKLLKNEANIYVTDSAYKIQMREGYNINSFIFSFYNSLSMVYSEIEGRYYGGGVLELTPSEFKKLPIPYIDITDAEFDEYANQFQNKEDIQEILIRNDYRILHGVLGLNNVDIQRIQHIHQKLLRKRLRN